MKKQSFNPYLPSGEYVPDGEPHVFGDRIYVYGSHDRFGGDRYCENDYVSWSAPVDDLSDWRYEGVIYRKDQDPRNPEGDLQLWAPDIMAGSDGRYYLYYCLSVYPAIGVAVCDSPCGAFEFYGHVKYPDGTVYGEREDDILPFDPGVINDDGTFYLYSNFSADLLGGLPPDKKKALQEGEITLEELVEEIGMPPFAKKINPIGSYVLNLDEDMLTVKSVKPLIPGVLNSEGTGFEGHEFYEASSIRKIGNKYYFVYSSILSHELAYAVSDKPDEGFVFGGMLVSNGDIGYNGRSVEDARNYWGNNHGGMVDINGQCYIFYHRQTNCNEVSRQGCAEPVTINEDGSIDPVEMTSCGLNGGALKGEGTYEAYIACNLRGKEGAFKSAAFSPEISEAWRKEIPHITQDVPDIDVPAYGSFVQYIKNMRDGSAAGFKYFDLNNLTEIHVVIRGDAGNISVSFDPDGDPAGECAFGASADWQNVAIPVAGPDGKQALYFTYHGEGSVDFREFTLGKMS